MIHYKQGRSTPEDALKELRAIANSPHTIGAIRRVQRDAELLKAALSDIHGGRWSIDINHRSCFVLIARDGD